MVQVPTMFDPWAVGNAVASNRLLFSPTSVGYAENGVLTPAAYEHYARRASGGAGVVVTEHLAVSDEGWQHRRQPAGWPDPARKAGLTHLAEEIRSHGALAFAQISHAGRYAGPWDEWAARPRLSASAVPFPLLGTVVTPREIDTDQMSAVVTAFATTTRYLVDAGFQGFEIHGGSGFLLSSFLSPLMNTRTDKWGGTAAGRVHFVQQVVEACVDAGGGAAVGVHLMVDELVDSGVTHDDLAVFVPALEESGAAFFRPGHGTFETLRLPRNNGLADGTDFNRAHTDALVDVATVPIVANGGLRTRADVEGALRGGAEAVALARPMLADPDWARKMRAGLDDQIVSCACNPALCLRTQLSGAVCAAWPDDVRERGHSGYNHVLRTSAAAS